MNPAELRAWWPAILIPALCYALTMLAQMRLGVLADLLAS